MRITGARWTPDGNWIALACDCGGVFETRAEWVDRGLVVCPSCRCYENGTDIIRAQFENEGQERTDE